MDFYDDLTEKNAVEWYGNLPEHLRKTIDGRLAKYKGGEDCTRGDDPDMWDKVVKKLGQRPAKLPVNNSIEGNTPEEIKQFDQRKKWVSLYNDMLLIKCVLEIGPVLQKERKVLSAALNLKDDLPDQADGLDITQAATVRWLQMTGETPLEFLANTYRDGNNRVGDRIQAARALLDYVHRKVPAQVDIKKVDEDDIKKQAETVQQVGEYLARMQAITKMKIVK